MVLVKIDTCAIWAIGHAGAAQYGADVVCASCSTLLYLLAYEVSRMDGAGLLNQAPVIRLESGDACICAYPKASERKRLEYLFASVGRMFRVLADTYPQFVSYESGKAGEHKESSP